MGLLNKMFNPGHHYKDSFKKTKQVFSGDIKGALTTGGIFGADLVRSMSSPKTPPSEIPQESPGAGMALGDPNDPAYGSFTKPFDVEEFYKQQDPGYAFRLQQGQQGVLNAASAGDGARTGAATKDLIGFNQNLASTEYGNAFNRYQTSQGNIFSRLFDIARLGQNAASGVGTSGTQLAGNAGSLTGQAGGASGAGIVGAGNALNDGATNAWLWKNWNQGGAKPQANNQAFYGNDF